MSWTKEQVLLLLDQYKLYPCLYVIKSRLYKNKHARNEALQNIAAEISKLRIGTTINEIKTKYNALRSTFLQEYKKTITSKKSGAGADDVYISNLYYYKKMEFVLDSGSEPRPATDSIEINSEVQNISEIEVDNNLDESVLPVDNNMPVIVDSEPSSPSTSQFPEAIPTNRKSKNTKKNSSDNAALESASLAITKMADAFINKTPTVKADYIDTFLAYIGNKIKLIKDQTIVDNLEEKIMQATTEAYHLYRNMKQ